MSAARNVVPDSPPASRLTRTTWRDPRLLLGLLLVVGSMALGARALAQADDAQQVWVASRALAPGNVVTSADVTLAQARLFDHSDRYLSGELPEGYVVRRALAPGELVPADALAQPGQAAERREVAVPVEGGHLPPDLARGDRVDVYVTPESHAGERSRGPRLVLRAAPVGRVTRDDGLSASSDQPVVLSVDPLDVLALVQAMGEGRVDLVRVPQGVP